MRREVRSTLTAVGVVLLGFALFIGYCTWQLSGTLGAMGPCGMRWGPYSGKHSVVSRDTLTADTSFDVHNGRILLAHVNDTTIDRRRGVTVLSKLDLSGSLQWTLLFDSVMTSMGVSVDDARLDTERHSIDFFNRAYSEPASFKFDQDWNFECMCQSPM